MHLCLIGRPFVPHNLLSTQESPSPLLKFQMAPRLKILMSSGSKKGTQICFSFLSKVPTNEHPPGSPTGPLWDDWYYIKQLHSFTGPIESYLNRQDFESVLLFKIPQHFVCLFFLQSKFIIYSTAFSLQYSLCALYFMMILLQYSSKPTVALSVNFYILQSLFILQGSATQYTLNVMRCKEENDGEARSNRLNCGLLKCQNDCDIPNRVQK